MCDNVLHHYSGWQDREQVSARSFEMATIRSRALRNTLNGIPRHWPVSEDLSCNWQVIHGHRAVWEPRTTALQSRPGEILPVQNGCRTPFLNSVKSTLNRENQAVSKGVGSDTSFLEICEDCFRKADLFLTCRLSVSACALKRNAARMFLWYQD
jgi:hypothetical protein